MGLTAARPGIVIGQSRAFGLARIATAVFFCFLAVTPGAAAVQPNSSVDRSLDELLDKWRCPVAAYLERIHRFPPKLENRYLILWSRRHPEF